MDGRKEILFRAEMSCEGCSNAITRILKRVDGVYNVNCDLPGQLVTVEASESVQSDHLLSKLQTWAEAAGKQVSLV
jgi:copper chaperone CopZ